MAKSRESNFIAFMSLAHLCQGKKYDLAGRDKIDRGCAIYLPAILSRHYLWHPVNGVLPAAPNNGTKNLQVGL